MRVTEAASGADDQGVNEMVTAEARLPDGGSRCRRVVVRSVAAMLSGSIAAMYVILMATVRQAELPRFEGDSTWGAYLLLAVPYLVGAGLLALVDRRILWVTGALIQLAVVVGFALFGIGVMGPDFEGLFGSGAFGYEALVNVPIEVWAGVITGAQLGLLGLLGYLALKPVPAATPITRESVAADRIG